MTVKQNHKYVAPDGHTFFPYLNEWSKIPSKSNLLGLIEVACNLFSIEPPLFSKPPPSLSAGMMLMMLMIIIMMMVLTVCSSLYYTRIILLNSFFTYPIFMNKNTERLTPFSCLTSLYDAYIIHLRIYLHDCISPNHSYLL